MQRPPYVLSVPEKALHAVGHIHPRRGADRTAAVRVTGPPPSASPGRRGDAPHETIQEFRHIDAQGDLRVFVGVLKP